MLVLSLDTTTRAGSVAVTRDGLVLALVEGDAARTHGERLPGEIEKALQTAGVQAGDLNLLVVASGPGAFTGLRIGLAAIQGLAMVLRIPVIGVSALEALADAAWNELGLDKAWAVAPWMDAARGEVFAALYGNGTGRSGRSGRKGGIGGLSVVPDLPDLPDLPVEISPPTVGTPSALLASLPATGLRIACAGDGAVKYASLIQSSPDLRVLERVPLLAPSLARLGTRRAARGAAGPPHALMPLYVRRPDAELDRDRHTGS